MFMVFLVVLLLIMVNGAAQCAAILQQDDTGEGDGIAVTWTALLVVHSAKVMNF